MTQSLTRLEKFAREDPGMVAKPSACRKTFMRTMPAYGSNRPSPCFTSESREGRYFPGLSVDMTNLPPVWYDNCIGQKREGCVSHPPMKPIDDRFLERFMVHGLMLPSERLEDHKILKKGIIDLKAARQSVFEYGKRRRILARKHSTGIEGIDYPLRPETVIYKDEHDSYAAQIEAKKHHDMGRLEHLTGWTRSAECLTEDYGSAPAAPRGSYDLGIQRKCVNETSHPARFADTCFWRMK